MKKCLFFSMLFWVVSMAAQKDSAIAPPVEKPGSISTDFKSPEFPGGHQAFVKEVLKNFQTAVPARLNIQKAKATATFMVETDGSMSNIQMESYEHEAVKNEFLKALKQVTTKWIPAEENGKKLRARMRQPLIFIIQ
ncbi:hypothetical protein CLU96_0658 [Chryseobacterium sp. 52]|uniref:hypothetical protein n=1 Tax=Chryseobacterium sp. 52 TaxID=2035213 RepID=UPI000C599163|nr:hypothetical protein [Chryseobacterium sp. 52]PIF43744.1 hypothetical protein CLU96_0658 [Chryseobacterium sp. 52]